ncbi:MAG: hypothetical protein RIC14_10805 [Filomicrobium sp.]
MSNSLLLTASLACSFAAYPAYARSIYKQNASPTRPTWLMILVTDLLLFAFMLAEARWDWLLLGFTAGNVLMLALMAFSDVREAKSAAAPQASRKRNLFQLAIFGNDPWTNKDKASVAVALGALALWALSGSGIAAICFSLAGKIASSVPMWINLYKDPEREAIFPWVLWAIGGTLYLFTIPQPEWSFASLATPILFVILECIIIALLFRRFETDANAPA